MTTRTLIAGTTLIVLAVHPARAQQCAQCPQPASPTPPGFYTFDMHMHPYGEGPGSGVKITQQQPPGQQLRSIVEQCVEIFLERHALLDRLTPTPVSQQVLAPSEGGDLRVLILTPSLKNPSAAAQAYISTAANMPSPPVCADGRNERGDLLVIRNLADIPYAEVTRLSHETPFYQDMAASPIAGDPRIFGVYDCGIDVIDSATGTITEQAIMGFGGNRLRTAEIGEGAYRLFALDTSLTKLLTAYDIVTETIVAQTMVPLAGDFDVSPGGTLLTVTTGEDRGTLKLLDSSSLGILKSIPVNAEVFTGVAFVAITADGTTALVADQGLHEVAAVRIAKEVIAQEVENVGVIIGTVPDGAFSPPNLAKNRRAALLNKLAVVEMHVEQAEAETDPDERDQRLTQAIDKLRNDILPKMDGFFGGDPNNDWVHTEEAQKMLVPLVRGLIDRLNAEYSPLTGPPPYIP